MSKAFNNVRKLNAIIYASDYGAKADGVTNDATALQAAITAVVATGGLLVLNVGTYELGAASLNVTGSCQIEGVGATLRRSADASVPLLNVTGSNVSISDIAIVSTFAGAPAASVNNCALMYIGGTNVHAENVTVTGRFYIGICMQSVIDSTITDCRVKGVRNRAYYLYLDWSDVSISDCFADGAETGGTPYCDYGFNLNPGGLFVPSRTNISGCTATNMTSQGFAVSERAIYTNIANCNAQNVTGGPGFLVQRANGFDQTDTNISNCQAVSCQIGFYVTECVFVNFTGCIALLSTTDGIFISDSDYIGIANCVARDNTTNGISLVASTASSVSRVTIIGNRCTTNGGTGIVSNANCYGLAVSANIALANTTAQINILGTANEVGNGGNIVV